MTDHTPNLEQPDDTDIDASLALDGFDASERYTEYGHDALRAAYRSGWADAVAVIRDSGYTVIALPEPSEYTPSGQPSWSRAISVAVDRFNEIVVGRTWWINRHEAADLGAALIAAAQLAKGDTQ